MNDPQAPNPLRPAAPQQPGTIAPRPAMPGQPSSLQPRVAPQAQPVAPGAQPQAPRKTVAESEPLSIVDDLSDASDAISQFRATMKLQNSEKQYKRSSNLTGNSAVHVKTFHGHLSDEGITRFDDRINEWLESHPNVEVKFATTTIALWDGKTKEQAIVVNIWY